MVGRVAPRAPLLIIGGTFKLRPLPFSTICNWIPP
jgi:hypothetical protein